MRDSINTLHLLRMMINKNPPVGETSHADSDSLQHPVAGELMHDQWRFHPARLLVGVRNDAADEVRFRLVQGVHQGGELDEVDRGDCLASASLLLLTLGLLFLGIWCGERKELC